MDTLKRWMRDWKYPTSLLCIYGFLSTVKPLEPFLIPFLTGPDKNLTIEQVTNQIFPVWTYSYLAVLVPVFLLTDWLRYKPVVVFQCLVLFATTAMILWCKGVPEMQAMQFAYGVVTSCDVAYFTYIYSMVELKHYLKATSYCRTAQLLGYTVGSVLGQVLVSFELMSYNNILVFTLVLTAVALITSIFLPMPKISMFFHQRRRASGETDGEGHVWTVKPQELKEESMTEEDLQSNGQKDGVEVDGSRRQKETLEGSSDNTSAKSSKTGGCGDVLLWLWRDFLQCFSSRTLLIWSAWWALSTCGYNQTVNYVQSLWEHVEPSNNFTVYNGGVEALSNLFGAAAAYGIGFSSADWSRWGEMALGVLSALEGGALFSMVFSANIWVCYCGYIIFKSLYMLLITIAMFQIAAGLNMERYALVFGANTFGALVLQTIITSVVVDSSGLGVDIVTQFTVYGGYFSVIAIVFFLRGLYIMCQKPELETPRENPEETLKEEDDAQITTETKF
ncbi:thiamine transporter 2 [Ctenopharyngodon idella]|uniref:thiamine transporter 2 n=1 Tax=Ctenopharyngodon idella TaxID=7959 RepID=UPI00222F3094|nr:thiamine transporter 2 [Ctenopharyngodon idella]XP_051719574.1 thiamine transporter 2 [Ctenopharyngodon idella]